MKCLINILHNIPVEIIEWDETDISGIQPETNIVEFQGCFTTRNFIFIYPMSTCQSLVKIIQK